jgi:Uma2 family endonuclease
VAEEKKTIHKEYTFTEPEERHVEEPAIAYGIQSERRYTYADYLTWMDNKYREIINGIVRLMSAPTLKHSRTSVKLTLKLEMYIQRRKGECKVFIAPVDVCLPRNGETADDKIQTVVQPDICVVCDPSKIADGNRCLGAPDLVMEVLSPSTTKWDTTFKFRAYEEAGVREYWVVYPKKNGITVFCLQANGKFDNGSAYGMGETVTSQVLPGLKIDLKHVFED